jgi:hypothetical protein
LRPSIQVAVISYHILLLLLFQPSATVRRFEVNQQKSKIISTLNIQLHIHSNLSASGKETFLFNPGISLLLNRKLKLIQWYSCQYCNLEIMQILQHLYKL